VEPGEDLEAAVLRELREETALEAKVVCALGTVTVTLPSESASFLIHEYLVVPADGKTPQAGDDAAEVRWVERREFDALCVTGDAIRVLNQGTDEALARGLLSSESLR
jgi:ADP-ribose pyrophosphatase YjhB (NUDIX family)